MSRLLSREMNKEERSEVRAMLPLYEIVPVLCAMCYSLLVNDVLRKNGHDNLNIETMYFYMSWGLYFKG